jgi:hypothetical protein
LEQVDQASHIIYDPKHLEIRYDSLGYFATEGFYQQEGGIRWTNGDARIGFLNIYELMDSVKITLNTYLPPISKGITPELTLTGMQGQSIKPLSMQQTGDQFRYTFYLSQPVAIRNISIQSRSFKATPPDQRVLSFPFISLVVDAN